MRFFVSEVLDFVRGAVVLCLALLIPAGAEDLKIQKVPPGTRIEDVVKAAKPRVAPDETLDAGDFYTLPGGRRVPLLRAKNSVAVSFASGAARDRGLASLKSRKELPEHDEVARTQLRKGGSFHILRSKQNGAGLEPKVLQADASVAYARHVLIDPKSKTRMIATDEILAAFREGTAPGEVRAAAARAGLQVFGRSGGGKMNVWRMRVANPKTADVLAIARTFGAMRGVLWAQPNFLREIRHAFTPPNPLFSTQQALLNSGLNQAVAGADVDAVHAWDRTKGNSAIVIAIIDDGVDISHPGLRIFTNPGESGGGKETNGVDDDGNGKIDDIHGWDFANDDNDPSPVGFNGHGTGTAGIAGGTFGTLAATVGIAGGCTILPVKIADDTGTFATDEAIGSAILYAASLADVLSNSWGGGSQSPYIDDAIEYAVTNGRNGKGCAVFFATGNYASTWYSGGGRYRLSTAGLNGSYYYSFFYQKGPTDGGEDTVRIDNVCLLDADGYTHKTAVLADEDFENWFYFPPFNFPPNGWWLAAGGGASTYWSPSATNAFTGTGGVLSAASPTLADGQYAWLLSPLMAITGNETFAFASSISIPTDSYLYIPIYDASYSFAGYYGPFNGVPDYVDATTTYPASHPKAIAVGAATDRDRRSDYSEYLGHLDFLAPSNGGWSDIATLDPLGAVGWTTGDYKMNFGGTSAATPLAAGIAALMLSVNPTLTVDEIRTIMHNTCDKIGGVTYGASGTHPEYGYGRVNAARAVESALPVLSIADVALNEGAIGTMPSAVFTITLSAKAVRDVTVQFATVDGTALAAITYAAASGTVTIPAGSTSAQVSVNIIGGTLNRPSAKFLVHLSAPTNAIIARSDGTCTIAAVDTDMDGIPDYWENLFGMNPHVPGNALLDPDGDGFNNLQEFLAGSNPHDAADPTIILGTRASDGDFFFTFKSVAGRTYHIEYADGFNAPTWLPFGTDITASGPTTEVPDVGVIAGQSSRFYRARVLP